MKKNNYTLGQLICTSLFSAFVAILSVMAALTVKPHATAQASVINLSAVATIAQPHGVVIFEAPTVAHVEVMPEATTATATTTTAKAAHSEAQTISDEEIEAVKQYCNTHRINAGFAELHTEEPPLLVAAK